MKNSVGAMMRCKTCNRYKPDRCICKKETRVAVVGRQGVRINSVLRHLKTQEGIKHARILP
jgi:hypothetical protein